MIRTLLDSPHPFLKASRWSAWTASIPCASMSRKTARRSCRSPKGDFGTPDGKCHFNADTLDYQPPVESRAWRRGVERASTRWN